MTAGALDFLPPELAPLAPRIVRQWQDRTWETAELTPARLSAIVAALERQGKKATTLTTARLVAGLGQTADHWCSRAHRHRAQAERLLPATTGYAPEMVSEALDRLFEPLRAPGLEALMQSEVGHLRHRPPRLVAVMGAGTVFPPAIVAATCALLLRSPVVIKSSSLEPVLAPLWARTLAECDPDLGSLVTVLNWSRIETELTRALFEPAEAVVAFGDDDTMAALGQALPPGATLIGHGHKVSAAILTARALVADARGLARRLARDVAIYDQQGCLSPHTVFVIESAATPARDFAALLAEELADLARQWPRGPLDFPAASALRQHLAARELAAEPPSSEFFGGFEAGYAVVLDSTPGFELSPLGRTVIVKPAPDIAAVVAALVPFQSRLQAIGLAVSHRERRALERGLGLLDDVETNLDWVPRIRLCPIGAMQRPRLTWAADGHRPLAALCPERS